MQFPIGESKLTVLCHAAFNQINFIVAVKHYMFIFQANNKS